MVATKLCAASFSAVAKPGSALRRRPCLAQGDGDRAVRRVVVQVLDLAFELLDLAGDLADLILHGDDVVDRLRVREQRPHRVQLRLGVGQACAQVDVLRADVGPGDVLALDVPDLGQRVDRGVEVGRRDHEVDDAGPDRAGLVSAQRLRLGVGAGDVAALALDKSADFGQLGAELTRSDSDAQLRLADDRRTLESGDRVAGQGRRSAAVGRSGRPAGAKRTATLGDRWVRPLPAGWAAAGVAAAPTGGRQNKEYSHD